jgi:tail-anchored protein insertion receptor
MLRAARTSLQNGRSYEDSMISYWRSWRRTVRPRETDSGHANDIHHPTNSETTEATTDSARATFDSAVSTLRWLGTNGLRMFLQFWYSKQAMFWIPKGWIPYYAEWLLSFPRAPLGSISIQAWFLACTAITILVSDALVAIVALVAGLGSRTAQKTKQPVAVPSEKAGAGDGKKEL